MFTIFIKCLQFTLRKSFRIWSYSVQHFSRIFPNSDWIRRNTEYLSYSVRMRQSAGKMRTRISPNTDSFYAVLVVWWGPNISVTHIKSINRDRVFSIITFLLVRLVTNELCKFILNNPLPVHWRFSEHLMCIQNTFCNEVMKLF